MAHILILKASDNEKIVQSMLRGASEIITSHNHTYDEISVPTVKELPIALNLFAETMNYEAAICVGILHEHPSFGLSEIHAREILRNLYEYSTYYALPIGIAVTYFKNPDEANIIELTEFTQNITKNIADMIQTIRQLNSLESEKYVQYRKHN